MALPIQPYSTHVSPAATELDQHENINNGRLMGNLNANYKGIYNPKFLSNPAEAYAVGFGVVADGETSDALAMKSALTYLAGIEGSKTLILPEGVIVADIATAVSTWGVTTTSTTFPFGGHTSVWSLAGISGKLTIRGAGKGRTLIVMPTARTLWDCYLLAADLDLTFEGITMAYTGGGSDVVESYATGILAHTGVPGRVTTLKVTECEMWDFNPSIYSNKGGKIMEIMFNRFLSLHGHASVSQSDGDAFPCTAIQESADSGLVKHNYFNGLVDPTFTGVNEDTTSAQRCPMDNFYEQAFAAAVEVSGNIIERHNIEGIHVTPPDGNEGLLVVIKDNTVSGAESLYAYSHGSRPGISLLNVTNAVVQGNTVKFQRTGINVHAGGPGVKVLGNTISECYEGVAVAASDGVEVSVNTFTPRTDIPDADLAEGLASSRVGVHLWVGSTNCLVTGNTLDGGTAEWWTAEATVAVQSGGTVNTSTRIYFTGTPTGFTVGQWAALIKDTPDGTFRTAPIIAVGANYIDLDAGFASVEFGDNAEAGDTVVQGGTQLADHAAVLVQCDADASNRVYNNTIVNYHVGVKRSGGSETSTYIAVNRFVNTTQKTAGDPVVETDDVVAAVDQVFTGTVRFDGPVMFNAHVDSDTECVMAGSVFFESSANYVRMVQAANAPGGIFDFLGGAAKDVRRGRIGFGHHGTYTGTVFLNELADSFSVMASNALHLGADSTIAATIQPSGGLNIGPTPDIDPGAANVNLEGVLKILGTKVLGAQGAAIADATDAGSAISQLNLSLAALRTHGLIAT